jgi:hypothetical protein
MFQICQNESRGFVRTDAALGSTTDAVSAGAPAGGICLRSDSGLVRPDFSMRRRFDATIALNTYTQRCAP